VDVVNRAFVPTAQEIAWARRVLATVAAAGEGAVAVDGRMVDRPVILRARSIVNQAGDDAH
jgi:citrate lyase subunit beta/citryl-CoA lyase